MIDNLVVAGALGTAWATWDKGLAAYAAGDYATARREWVVLARRGNPKAQYNLGVLYSNGKGVPESGALAFRWYVKAAEQGHVGAQFGLGSCYFLGKGVPINYVKAYMWLSIAEADGHAKAKNGLKILKPLMSSYDLSEGESLFCDWRQKNRK